MERNRRVMRLGKHHISWFSDSLSVFLGHKLIPDRQQKTRKKETLHRLTFAVFSLSGGNHSHAPLPTYCTAH